jgi:pimeloyl-ACP methyl ester carboxylesterase
MVGSNVESDVAWVDGLKIAFDLSGSGEPALVLIHGALGDRTYFAPLLDHLAQRRRVVAPDLRGHGESDAVADLSIEDFDSDVMGVLDRAGVQDAVLCGHSMMGAVALSVASAHPGSIKGVVMLDSPILYPEPVRQQAAQPLLPALQGDHWRDAAAGFFERMFDPNDPAEVRDRVSASLDTARPRPRAASSTACSGRGSQTGRAGSPPLWRACTVHSSIYTRGFLWTSNV